MSTEAPETIPPGLAPGGIVFRVYDEATGICHLEQRVLDPDDCEREGTEAAAVSDRIGDDALLVGYDGDSGERLFILPRFLVRIIGDFERMGVLRVRL